MRFMLFCVPVSIFMNNLIRIITIMAFLVAMPAKTVLAETVEQLLTVHADIIAKSSRKTIAPAIDALRDSGLPEAAIILEFWRDKELWLRKEDKRFFLARKLENKAYELSDPLTGDIVGESPKKALKQIKPNSGIRGMISAALVQFQLGHPDPAKRMSALEAIKRDPDASQLEALRASIASETDPELQALKQRLVGLLTLRFGETADERITAINSFRNDLGLDVRAALNTALATKRIIQPVHEEITGNPARELVPEPVSDDVFASAPAFSLTEAYQDLSDQEDLPPILSADAIRQALEAHINQGRVAEIDVASLSDPAQRQAAYEALAAQGLVQPAPTPADMAATVADYRFLDMYLEQDAQVTDAARTTLETINASVSRFEYADIALDSLSLASIYFLAAIGLAITFGVMGVINMAHGEFIMMGAYTGYVVQLFVPNYTLSILLALPLAFAVTFAAGIAMERLVIRFLYHRPLETLLATFGISIALQQIAKNVFGTQARPLTAPEWMDGALVVNDVLAISWIRIAIFVLGLCFLFLLLYIMNRTRLGLEVRAVTQNPRMAASVGIDTDRIRMLTFGLGSGIAGIAGVAIGLYAKVTSSLGQDYIVQSFMTVVVGGVGNLFGVVAGAAMIGSMQKIIEAFNPSNTLAAQTYMIVFIIIFIQFRPRGLFALRGRAAGD